MRKKLVLIMLVVLALGLIGGLFLDPTHVVRGALRGEAFCLGRPVSYWREGLASKDTELQRDVMQRLKENGDAAVPVLVVLLKESDGADWESAKLRWRVVNLLGMIGPNAAEALPALIEAMRDEDLHVRTLAATVIGVVTPQERQSEAIPALAALLGEGTTASTAAARTLGQFGPQAKSALPALVEALKSEDVENRWSAAQALGSLGAAGKAAVPSLITALQDPSEMVRESAAEALGNVGPEARAGVRKLTELLKDPVAQVRRSAAQSLGQIGPEARTALDALKALEDDDDGDVRNAANRAVRILETKPAKSDD